MKKIASICAAIALVLSLSACGHTHTWLDATCTQAKTCSICGEQEGEALGHTWGGETCTTSKTCAVCGKTEGVPKGHSVAQWTIAAEPTCALVGQERGTCEKCGATVQRDIPKLEHTPGEWTVTKDATVDAPGERTRSCTVCGKALNTEAFTLSAEEIEAQYKASCTAYTYDMIARDPDEYEYTEGKYTGEIIQVLEDGKDLQLRVDITKTTYGYTDTIYVLYTQKEGESRLLEDDIVTIYGTNMGTMSYQSVLGATITLPCVYAKYIERN